jgi:hypothetical protein
LSKQRRADSRPALCFSFARALAEAKKQYLYVLKPVRVAMLTSRSSSAMPLDSAADTQFAQAIFKKMSGVGCEYLTGAPVTPHCATVPRDASF